MTATANSSLTLAGGHPAEPLVYIPLSTLNVILSAFSAVFFLVKEKAVHPVLRRLVVTMSVFEILFHLSVILTYVNILLRPEVRSGSVEILILQTVLRFSLTMRNWTMGFISWSRVEAVFKPMSSRSDTAFKAAYIVVMETIAAVVGLVLSVLMVTAQDRGLSLRLWTQRGVHAIEIVFYTYQGIVPILSILVATVVTVLVLKKASNIRRRLYKHEVGPKCRQLKLKSKFAKSGRRQSQRERQSVRLIVCLSLTCLLLESPTDVFGFIKNKAPVTELVVNTLVELDSLCNFFIYTCTTSMLRQLCRRRSSSQQGTGGASYQRSPQGISADSLPSLGRHQLHAVGSSSERCS